MDLRALSVKQPWASLLVAGVKRFEVRSWQPKRLGIFLVHGSSGKAPEMPRRRGEKQFQDALRRGGIEDERAWIFSAFVGAVDVVRIWEPDKTPRMNQLHHYLGGVTTGDDDIILDFFAGSGTTAHAVLDLNRQDGASRRFILVQLPEPTGREDFQTIADVTKDRVRRVAKRLSEEDAGRLALTGAGEQDRGFRVFKLAESNFKPWIADAPHDAKALERQLELHVDHVRPGRGDGDLLHEILLKSGYSLTAPVETVECAGRAVSSVAGGDLLVCVERALTLELIRAMAERRPARVVCLDQGFAGNDQLKANAVQILKTKGVTSFKTV